MLKRFKSAYSGALRAFRAEWAQYDKLSEARVLIANEQAAERNAMSQLDDSDKHFLRSWVNNLTGDKRPSREQAARFMEIVGKLPMTLQKRMVRDTLDLCPSLAVYKVFREWGETHLPHLTA